MIFNINHDNDNQQRFCHFSFSAVFLQVNSKSDQSMGWSGGVNSVTMETKVHFRNIHQSNYYPFNLGLNSIAKENNFGTDTARYGN